MNTDCQEPMLRVVVVDNEASVRTLIRIALERDRRTEVVGEADGSPAAVIDACRRQPDVVLLDQHLDGLLGTTLIGDIVRTAPKAMVALLSALDASMEEAAALSAGAFVYYEKSMLGTSLTDVLLSDHRLFHRALAGEEVLAPSALSRRGWRTVG